MNGLIERVKLYELYLLADLDLEEMELEQRAQAHVEQVAWESQFLFGSVAWWT